MAVNLMEAAKVAEMNIMNITTITTLTTIMTLMTKLAMTQTCTITQCPHCPNPTHQYIHLPEPYPLWIYSKEHNPHLHLLCQSILTNSTHHFPLTGVPIPRNCFQHLSWCLGAARVWSESQHRTGCAVWPTKIGTSKLGLTAWNPGLLSWKHTVPWIEHGSKVLNVGGGHEGIGRSAGSMRG